MLTTAALRSRSCCGSSGRHRRVLSLAGQMAVALLFSILLGLWIPRSSSRARSAPSSSTSCETAQAELGRSHHAAGVAAERERLAREIHDTLAQGFTSVVMLAQTAGADLRPGRAGAARDRLAAGRAGPRATTSPRPARWSRRSPPSAWTDATLGEALARLADGSARRRA